MNLLKTLLSAVLVLTTAAAHASPITLNKAESRLHSKYGYTWQTIRVEAHVENLAYDKSITLHFEQEDGNWSDLPLAFRGEISPGVENWTYEITRTISGPYSSNEPLDLNFVLKYDVNGQTYWDNNNGSNYWLAAGSGELTTQPIVIDTTYARAPIDYSYGDEVTHVRGYFNASFVLQNYDYSKTVEIHYTYDNWQTTHIGYATYQPTVMKGYSWVRYPNANNVEIWSFNTRGDEAQNENATEVKFAVKYTVDGATYWNNNRGANFTVPVTR